MPDMKKYKIPILLGVTGHRDIVEAQYTTIEEILLKNIQVMILDKYPGSPVKLMTPLADGADRLVARIAIKLGLDIVVPLPMPEQVYKNTFLGESGSAERQQSVDEFDELKLFASPNEEFLLPQLADENELASNLEAQSNQFALLGAFMAKHCHVLIALYDGNPSESVGGTSQIFNYRLTGQMNGLPLKIDSEDYEKIDFVMPDNMFDTQHAGLLWHITVSRKSSHHSVDVTFAEKSIEDSLKTVDYHDSLRKIHGFNADVDSYQEQLGRAKQTVSHIPELENHLVSADMDTGCLQGIRDPYVAADQLAIIYAGEHHDYFMIFCLALSGIAVSEWFFSHEFNSVAPLWAYIVFLGVGYLMHRLHRNRSVHNKYNEYRALAEALRVQFYWRCAGLKSVVSDHYLRKHQIDTNWIAGAVKAVSYKSYNNNMSNVDFVETAWIKDQKVYFENKLKGLTEIKGFLKTYKAILYVLMYVFALIGIYSHELLSHVTLSALLGMIPLLYVLIEHKSTYMSQSELIRSYNVYYRLFARAYESLEASKRKGEDCVHKAKLLIYQLGCEALIENGDWLIINRDKKAEKPE